MTTGADEEPELDASSMGTGIAIGAGIGVAFRGASDSDDSAAER